MVVVVAVVMAVRETPASPPEGTTPSFIKISETSAINEQRVHTGHFISDIMDNLKGFIPKHDKDSDKDESDEDLSDEDDDDSSDNDQMDWASIFGGFSDKYMNGTNSQGFNEQDSTNQTQQDQQNGTISQAFAKFFKG
ncbi:uncharacterized protein LOC110441693 isoform X3 [Mizuhopecten yessoensis]|uniref:uncharacterized protein LOC110441693 isoform X3 n=1 Tax=Mizuhopecten yessoensis TaxID=6573 RepID=UPI000B457B03|nr:uncharacterized protein LOC110441693 isoform X3 [Mizuhopecten yessoensis]